MNTTTFSQSTRVNGRKIFAPVLAPVLLLLLLMGFSFSASAASVGEKENNNSIAVANLIAIQDSVSGVVSTTDDEDYFQFTLLSSGRLTIKFTSYIQFYSLYLYNSSGKDVWKNEKNEYVAENGVITNEHNVHLSKGTYYLKINGLGEYGHYYTGNYSFLTKFVSADETLSEPNNSIATAAHVDLHTTHNGQIAVDDDVDYVSFSLTSAGMVSVKITSYIQFFSIYLYDEDGIELWKSEKNNWAAESGMIKKTYDWDLSAGTYYFKINGLGDYGYYYTGNFSFSTTFVSANETLSEPNNSLTSASAIQLNKTENGQIALNDSVDYISFSLTSAGQVSLKLTSFLQFYSIYLYDQNGSELWKSEKNNWAAESGMVKKTYDWDLSVGTYYFKINGLGDYGYYYTGNFSFSTTFVSANETLSEPNNSLTSASVIKPNRTAYGQIALSDTVDYVAFYLNTDEEVKINITSYMKFYSLYLYDEDGTEIWRNEKKQWNAETGEITNEYSKALSSGRYTLKINGLGDYGYYYTGNYQLKIISSNSPSTEELSPDNVTLYSATVEYNSKQRTPSVTVKNAAGTVLAKDKDYTVKVPSGRKNAGTYVYEITGIGNYTGTVKKNFVITPQPLKAENVSLYATPVEYNGKQRTPSLIVKNKDGTVLKNDVDYTCSVVWPAGRTVPGTYSVTIKNLKGINNYSGSFGSISKVFTIKPCTLKAANVTLYSATVEYNGKQRTPKVTVTSPWGVELTEGTHYTVKVPAGRQTPGSYTYVITGKGRFTGTVKKTFTIKPCTLKAENVSLYSATVEYNGKQRTPSVTVKSPWGVTLTEGTHYTVKVPEGRTEAGKYTYVITGKGRFTGTVNKVFTIKAAAGEALQAKNVTLYAATVEYNGKVRNPAVTVKNAAGTVLTKGTDYTVKVPDGRKIPGKYYYVITGKGKYSGTVNKVFTIKACTLTAANVTLYSATVEYNSKQRTPKVTVKSPWGVTLTEGTHYTVTVPAGRTVPGIYVYKITGKGRFAGTVNANFVIKPCTLKAANVTLYSATVEYNGKVRTPKVTVKSPWGVTLTEGTHYTVTVPSGRTVPGTYVYKITGKGRFTGTVSKTFTIKPCTLKAENVSLYSATVEYNGKQRTPKVTVKSPWGVTLTEGTHYTVTVPSGRTARGTYVYKITGKGRFTGTVSKGFTIK